MEIKGNSMKRPTWMPFEVDFSQFSAAALTKQINLFELPDGCKLHGVFNEPVTSFAGTGVTSLTISVGTSVDADQFSSAFGVMQTSIQQDSETSNVAWGSNDQIICEAVAVGANLDQLTAGKIKFRLLISKIS